MSKYIPKRLLPEKLPISKRAVKRAVALTLSVSIMASLLTFLPVRSNAEGNPLSSPEKLYTREADKNTMDSYVQASLGGLIYLQEHDEPGVDGVSTATIRNNFGTRYAGEVWADKSVFARYQNVIAEIRPFEAGHVYPIGDAVKTIYEWNGSQWTVNSSENNKTSGLNRALQTLHYWLMPNKNIDDANELKIGGIETVGDLRGLEPVFISV